MMTPEKEKALMECTNLDELLTADFGEPGTPERDEFDAEATAFCLAETMKEERLRLGLTQNQLAEMSGTSRSSIYKLEHGKTDISLGTLFQLFKVVGKSLNVNVI